MIAWMERQAMVLAIAWRLRQPRRFFPEPKMPFRRPIVASRLPEVFWFILAAIYGFFPFGLLALRVARGSIGWGQAAILVAMGVMVTVLPLGIGLLYRRRRLRLIAELREYERILAAGYSREA